MKIFHYIVLICVFCFNFVALSEDPANTVPSSDNIVLVNPESLTTGGYQNNQSELTNALCTIILIMNGRIARVIAAVAIFAVGIMFFMGKITWPIIVTVAIAMGLVFGAKTIALAILPRAVNTYDKTQGEAITQTTSEVLSQACPELL